MEMDGNMGVYKCKIDMANQVTLEGDLSRCIFNGEELDWFLQDDPGLKRLKTDNMALGKLWQTNAALSDIKDLPPRSSSLNTHLH